MRCKYPFSIILFRIKVSGLAIIYRKYYCTLRSAMRRAIFKRDDPRYVVMCVWGVCACDNKPFVTKDQGKENAAGVTKSPSNNIDWYRHDLLFRRCLCCQERFLLRARHERPRGFLTGNHRITLSGEMISWLSGGDKNCVWYGDFLLMAASGSRVWGEGMREVRMRMSGCCCCCCCFFQEYGSIHLLLMTSLDSSNDYLSNVMETHEDAQSMHADFKEIDYSFIASILAQWYISILSIVKNNAMKYEIWLINLRQVVNTVMPSWYEKLLTISLYSHAL